MPPIVFATIAPMVRLPSRSEDEMQTQANRLTATSSPKAEHSAFSHTQSHLCLALIIQKLKPNDISTRDFFSQIRKHIQKGRPSVNGEHHYIETAAFWKDQYTKVYSEKKAMETQIAQMEALLDHSKPGDKAATFELFSLGVATNQQLESAFGNAESTRNIPLLRQAMIVYRLLKDDKVATDTLVKAIRSTLSYVNSAISDACQIIDGKVHGSTNNSNHVPTPVFGIAALVYNICLKGLSHLCRDIQGRRSKGQLIFPLVQVFVKALEHLNHMCVQSTTRWAPRIAQNQEKVAVRADSEDNARTSPLISELAKFLVNILASPEFQNGHVSYGEVLEGIFSALLKEVGGLVSDVNFGEHPSTFHGLAVVPQSDIRTQASANAATVDLKCRYLAFILKRAVDGRSEKDKYTLAAALAGTKVSATAAGQKMILARARQRLQEALLKGIFGDNGDEFKNALKMPESKEYGDDEAPQIARDEREAFLESVWSAIGWDILSSD